MINLIVAIAKNRAIGYKGDLLTHIPGDLPRFKQITTGHTIIMGRKTMDSFPRGPLPNRDNIVITRNRNLKIDGALVVHSLEDAINSASKDKEIFIIGGGEIYNEALPYVDKLYITHVDKEFEADTFFPEIPECFKENFREDHFEDPNLKFSYVNYVKE